MDNLLNFGIQFVLWLQSLGSWLTPVMKVFTFLGNEQFYLIVAPAILWCIDSKLGLRMGLFLMVNETFKNVLKVAFHGARPYWYSQDVKVFGVADGSFGVPSGHSQNSVVVWGTIAERVKRRWVWVLAIILIFLIGISRIYLAVHFPHDVLVGWLFGAVLLWAFLRLERPVINWIKGYTPGVQILIAFLFSLVLILLALVARLSLGGWILPMEWVNNAQAAFPKEPAISPLSIYSFMANPGTFFGLAAGWIWLMTQGGFKTRDIWWKLLLRYLLGVVGVLVFYSGLGAIFPKSETLIAYILRYIRYALIGFWSAGFAPWLFVKFGLAKRLN